MWHMLRTAPGKATSLVDDTLELLQSTTRRLILVTIGAYLIWYAVVADLRFDQFVPTTLITAPFFGAMCGLALWLIPRHLRAAQVAWLAGLIAAITLTLLQFQEPALTLLYVLCPLMATFTMGWMAGLLSGGLLIALAQGLAHTGALPVPPNTYGLAMIACGALAAALGGMSTAAALTENRRLLDHYREVQSELLSARRRQMELKQVQEDLIHANRELARLSDRLTAMQHAAQEARRAKEEFVANVSHELRTPLNMIIGFSEMITQSPRVYGGRLPRALLADISAIQRNSQHLSKLVNDVLDLSQVDAGRMALSKEWTSLQTIVDAAVAAVQALFESKGLYLEAEIPAELPPVFCDSTRIRQIVINLLSNAGRFTEQGGVRVRAWQEGANIVVSVADTGPGIPPEDQQRLFEPFQQLDSSIRRQHGGSGLGLTISKRFVEMHGGALWLESQVGRGTTFYFRLPADAPSPATSSDLEFRRWFSPYHPYEEPGRPFKAPAPKVPPRFVIVEPDDTLQQLFTRYMDDVEVVSVRDKETALAELRRSPAKALVMNTFAAEGIPYPVEQWNDLPYDTPVVSCCVPGEEQAARRLGVTRYLTKPITREVLLGALAECGKGVRNVLLADDEPEVLQLFARMLQSTSTRYRVLLAADGEQALDLLRERKPDVMLLDLIMPGLSGFDVLRAKSQDASIQGIPVVIISSRDPLGEPIVSSMLSVTRRGGFSVRDLLVCIQGLSEMLSPRQRSDGQARPESSAG